MEIREDRQSNPIVDEVGALVAVSRPVIAAVLQSISAEVLNTIGERDRLPLRMLGRLRKKGDGDCGIAFEYAVHDAVISAQPIVVERVADALNKCRIVRGEPASILFAIEKSGAQQLISTEHSLITDNSRVLTGQPGQPVKLKKYLTALAAAFRRPGSRLNLPQSIRGLWKADLFLGSTAPDHWVGTTVKINPHNLEAARGLRVAIVPSFAGTSDRIRVDEQKNLVVCPLPHDGSFMQVFYEGWRIVQALCERDFKMPREVDLPNSVHREVARMYIERRDFAVADVIHATRKFAQPELLTTSTETVPTVPFATTIAPGTSTIISPFPRMLAACPRATLCDMEIREDRQRNPVADEVSALVAVTGPIIAGVLESVPAEVTNAFTVRDQVPLKMLGQLRKKGNGDCGIAFEYAIHDAVISQDASIAERVADALNMCQILRGDPASILFATEKSGAQQLISTEPSLVTESSPVLLGEGGRPVGLREHLSAIGAAFRLPGALLNLAQSIRGLWKTDLFLGSAELDRWVGATVNISRSELRAAKGPRIAIIPSAASQSDAVRLDEQKNLVICPVPRDGSFLQIFYQGWQIVQALCAGDFALSGVTDIPNPVHREVARIFAERRDFPIVDVIEAIRKFAQPELLTTSTETVRDVPFATTAVAATSTIITPIPRASSSSPGLPDTMASPAY